MLIFTRVLVLPHAPTPHRFLVATLLFYHERQLSAAKGPEKGSLSVLNMAIDGLNLAKETTSTTPVNSVFGSVAVLLTMIRVCSFLFRHEMFWVHSLSGHKWPTSRIMSISGYLALISAKRSKGGWAESS